MSIGRKLEEKDKYLNTFIDKVLKATIKIKEGIILKAEAEKEALEYSLKELDSLISYIAGRKR